MILDLPLQLAEQSPYYKHLGITIVEAREGFAKLRLNFMECLTHPFGYLHGGAVASLADSAGINAVLTMLKDEQKALTLKTGIDFGPVLLNMEMALCKEILRGNLPRIDDSSTG